MALFSRRSWPTELTAIIGRARVLASANGRPGPVVGLADRLVFPLDGHWYQQPWHTIERGGWNRDDQVLAWTTIDGDTTQLPLSDPGKLPQLFEERVNATIVYTGSLRLDASATVLMSARRDLTNPDAPLVWRASPGKGTDPNRIKDEPLVRAELARLRDEYGTG